MRHFRHVKSPDIRLCCEGACPSGCHAIKRGRNGLRTAAGRRQYARHSQIFREYHHIDPVGQALTSICPWEAGFGIYWAGRRGESGDGGGRIDALRHN
ncbi:Hypothetical protein ETEE_2556 [Edwardsiella anguillarum ET080813]|uniref:Uncharacterized protein n=1 Tax=Edwardsiella anguillarum ET080813 TaxID=667120 RepID=A0A076LTV0_9GAMM|nr:Hypothetical protein ETEE_2556 [Edwardsiella anguillarum ET080813]